jgi:hypothetical protein
VNMGAAVAGAIATLIALYKIWAIAPPMMTCVRSAIAGGIIYTIGIRWITPDPSFVLKLLALSLIIPMLLTALGELNKSELQFVTNWVTQKNWFRALKR